MTEVNGNIQMPILKYYKTNKLTLVQHISANLFNNYFSKINYNLYKQITLS